MKTLLSVLLLLCSTISQAKNYYLSNKGDNSANGLTPATAWQTIAKVNASFTLLAPGDSVLLKCGDSFYGTIVVRKSGTAALAITIGSYGTGAKPLLTGFTTLSAWVATGNGIYQAAAPTLKAAVNLLTINGVPQAVGRYPNADAPNGGYLSYENFSGTSSITDNQLTASPNWTGAEVVIRKQHCALERCLITAHNGGTLSYATTPSIDPLNNPSMYIFPSTKGFGYFIQRDPRTLDEPGEWYFNNATGNMQVFFGPAGPASSVVKAAALDTLISIGANSYINITGIAFEGANAVAVYGANGGNITIRNCNMTLMGGKGVLLFNCHDVLVDSLSASNVLCNVIDLTARHQNNATVTNCTLTNNAMLAGMGSFWDDNDYKAISVSVNSGALIQGNTIDHNGFVGIQFQGNNVMVKNNFVNYFDFVKDDGGGIYTYQSGTDAVPGVTYTNRTIRENIVLNGIGASAGTNTGIDVDAIYLDGRTKNVDILNNTTSAIGVNGIYCNNPGNVNISGNTCFNDGSVIGINRYTYGMIGSLSIKNNIFYPRYATQANFTYSNGGINVPVPVTIQSALQSMGQIDSNFIAVPNVTGFTYSYAMTDGAAPVYAKPLSLDGWKAFSGHDIASRLVPSITATYRLDSLLGPNTVANGQFVSGLGNITAWSPNTNLTASWDNTGKVTGAGSLKLAPAVASTDFTFIYGSVGAVVPSKKYILRFTTVGSSSNGILGVFLRQTALPRDTLAAVQMQSFGTAKTVHEFLFTAPVAEANASFLIEVQQGAGTTYIDDISFYEAAATPLSPDSLLRFEYNASMQPKTIALDGQYLGPDSTLYDGTITIQPFRSAVLIKIKNNPTTDTTIIKVDAGKDISLILPTNNVVLKGNVTGIVTTYSWTKIAGPAQFVIAHPTSQSTVISNLSVGKYTFQLKVTNANGDSAMALVNVTATGILPVTLIDFSGNNTNDKITLQWKVASEINVSHYAIERSNNGKDFENIGQLNSNNLVDITSNYNYADNSPLKGVNYYRLVMVDKDGAINYSKVISLLINSAPSFNVSYLSLSTINTSVKIGLNSNYQQIMNLVIVDVSGRILITVPLQLQKGFNAIDKKIPAINRGVYYIKLLTDQQFITQAVLTSR